MNGRQNVNAVVVWSFPKNMNWYCVLASFLTKNHPKLLQISKNSACKVVKQTNKYISVCRSNDNFPKILDSHSIVDVNKHVITSLLLKTLEQVLAESIPSTNFDALCYIVWYCTTQVDRLFSGIYITQPSDEYLLKLHFVVGGTPKFFSSSIGRFLMLLIFVSTI